MELKPKQIEMPSHSAKRHYYQDNVLQSTLKETTVATKNKPQYKNAQKQPIKTENIFFDLIIGLFGAIITFMFCFAIFCVGVIGFLKAREYNVEIKAGTVIFITGFSILFVGVLYSFLKCIIKFMRGLVNFIKHIDQIVADCKKAYEAIKTHSSVSSYSQNYHVQGKQLPDTETRAVLIMITFFLGLFMIGCLVSGNISGLVISGFFFFFIRKQLVAQIKKAKDQSSENVEKVK